MIKAKAVHVKAPLRLINRLNFGTNIAIIATMITTNVLMIMFLNFKI